MTSGERRVKREPGIPVVHGREDVKTTKTFRPGPDGVKPELHVEVLKGDPGVYTDVNDGGAARQVPAPQVGRTAAPAVAEGLAIDGAQ